VALSAADARLALVAVTSAGVTDAEVLLGRLNGSPEQVRAALFEVIPALIDTYSLGSSALAVDWYDDLREEAAAPGRFTSEPVIPDRAEKVRNMLGWATQPLFDAEPNPAEVGLRLLPSVQYEIALPNRATLTTNVHRDPAANGWQRVASGGCKFCRMLAGRGAVYKEDTAHFASHTNCHCTAQPVFQGHRGVEADVVQYAASKRRGSRTPADKARVREFLASMPD